MQKNGRNPAELHEWAVRMVFENERELLGLKIDMYTHDATS